MNDNKDVAVQITDLKKKYRLGVIGGGTLQGDIQSWWAKKRGNCLLYTSPSPRD